MRARGVKVGAWTVVVASIALAITFSSRFGSDPDLIASPLIGRPAPDVTLPALYDDAAVALTDLSGEIVVVNFFASWCLECRNEHADLVSTAQAFAGEGVRFVQVAFDDTPDASRGFIDDLGRSPVTLYLDDPDSRAAIAFGVFGVPETYFIDVDGTVVGKIQGESDALLLGRTIDRIKAGERPGAQVVGDVQQAPGE